ncbi:SRPBCC family protein [bacterium]|nr:SRPBCC family protein [bacterium]
MSMAAAELDARSIVVSRRFDAPRELVFSVFTEPRHLERWWGPNGFSTSTSEFDFRPGGRWRYVMHGPDGRDYPNRSVFTEITPPERIVYLNGWDVEDAEPMFEATINFEEDGAGTLLNQRMVFPTAASRNEVAEKYGAVEGAQQHLQRLSDYLNQLQD